MFTIAKRYNKKKICPRQLPPPYAVCTAYIEPAICASALIGV